MGVVVFDSDVLVGFLNRDDTHHQDAVEIVRSSMVPGSRRLLCAVNYAEIMVGPNAIHAEHRGWEDVEMVSFDESVVKAHRQLHPNDG